MKKIVSILVLILFTGTISLVNAQDVITKKDGSEIRAKVTEVGVSEIKYKVFGNESGPTYTLPKSQIFMIVYQGGIKEVFNTPETAPVQTPPQNKAPITGVGVGSQPKSSVPKTEKVRKFFVEGGFSTVILGDSYFGLAISGGYYISPNDRLSFDFSAHFNNEPIGTFSYTWGDEKFYDGEISRNYSISPILLSWGHEFRLSQNFNLRIGPSIGINRLSAYDSYTTKSHDVSRIEDIPDRLRVSKSLFTVGAVLGLEWKLFKPSGIGFNYGFFANKSTTFEIIEINTITQLIKISYWWKF
jgi:hypothetical protein